MYSQPCRHVLVYVHFSVCTTFLLPQIPSHRCGAPGKISQQSSNPEVVFCPSSGTLYQRQASLLKTVTQDLKLSLGVVTCLPDDEDCYGFTSITSSSCTDLYSLAAVSNITRRAVPSHYDQGGSGSGSGSGAVPTDLSVCDEVSISSSNSSIPPPTMTLWM